MEMEPGPREGDREPVADLEDVRRIQIDHPFTAVADTAVDLDVVAGSAEDSDEEQISSRSIVQCPPNR